MNGLSGSDVGFNKQPEPYGVLQTPIGKFNRAD